MKKDIIIFDVETKSGDLKNNRNNIFNLGIACIVTYSFKENSYRFFGDTPQEHLKALNYLNGKTCCGYNIINFDSILLLGNDRIITNDGTTRNKKYEWENIDIYIEIMKCIYKTKDVLIAIQKYNGDKRFHRKGLFALENILKNTLGNMFLKNGNGKNAPDLWKQNKTKELFEYCLNDVKREKELFLFCKNYGRLVNNDYDVVEFSPLYNSFME